MYMYIYTTTNNINTASYGSSINGSSDSVYILLY